MKPGIYFNLPNNDYHGSEGVSSSQLKYLLRGTPAAAKYKMDHPTEASGAMRMGTAVHTLVLEPEKFDLEVEVIDCSTQAYAKINKAVAEFKDKAVITTAQKDIAKEIQRAVRANPVAYALLCDAQVENSIYVDYASIDSEGEPFSELIKVRPDIVSPATCMIADLKTARDASPQGFARDAAKFGYPLSAAMYVEACNASEPFLEAMGVDRIDTFTWIVVENEAPYQVAIYELGPDDLVRSTQLFRLALERYHKAKRDGWPSYPQTIEELPLHESAFEVKI